MKFVLIFLCCLIATFAFAEDDEQVWKSFKLSNKKSFGSPQTEITRKQTFLKNKNAVAEHNKRFKDKKETYEMKVDQYSDLSTDEFRKLRTGRRPDLALKLGATGKAKQSKIVPLRNLPLAHDWCAKGVNSSVKNQGECGSCYTFSTTAALECQYYMTYGKRVDFSPQQCVDCSDSYGNFGCGGGLEQFVFRYIKDYGIESLASYPYTGVEGRCKHSPYKVVAYVKDYQQYTNPSVTELKSLLVQNGPVTVAMSASTGSLSRYSRGVYCDRTCPSGSKTLDHTVLLVGYGTENGVDYWKIKNSWGPNWGEDGYIRICQNGNICGITNDVNSATIL